MKKLFIVSCFIFFALYPPHQSEAKIEAPVKTSIKNFEKINRETLVNQFFREYHELNKRIIKVENHLNK